MGRDLISHGVWRYVLIINKDKTLSGIVTEHDILKVLMEGKDLNNVNALDIMTISTMDIELSSRIRTDLTLHYLLLRIFCLFFVHHFCHFSVLRPRSVPVIS